MTPTPSPLRRCVLLTALLLPLVARAQIAAGKDKFLGNVINTTVPASFNTYWNQVTPENAGKWGSVEGTRNVMNWMQLDLAYNHAKASGFKFKLHTLVWGSQYPAWIAGLPAAELRTEIEEWMTLLAARYPDVWAIDVVNEPIQTPINGTTNQTATYKAALGGDGATGWDWVITSFQLARQKFPNAKLILNEYGTENNPSVRASYKTIIGLLKDRGLIDGIGLQAHYFNIDSMNTAGVTAMLDDYATLGLDIYITELDITGGGSDEIAQRSKYADVFLAMWDHPRVKGVTLWGYIVGQTWRPNTGILNADGTERAALSWLRGIITGAISSLPPPPSNLAATASSSSQIALTWTDNALTETSYKVESAASANGPWTELTGSLVASTTAYSVTGLTASTTYHFRVRASHSGGSSDYSNTASATTSAAPVVTPPVVTPPSSSGGGGGGGAPSLWFLAVLTVTVFLRVRRVKS